MKPRNPIIINESKKGVDLYHIRVEVGGVPLWTGVYAESVERANRIATKMFGKGNVRGRPTKVSESKIVEGAITLYRGVNPYQTKGHLFWTTDREWARQFTNSGLDKEIKTRKIPESKIYRPEVLPKAFGMDDSDIAIIKQAQSAGYPAIWMDEGSGQPKSVFFIPSVVESINEQAFSPASYGYWITKEGKILPVDNRQGHEAISVNVLGYEYPELEGDEEQFWTNMAMKVGWIRVTVDPGFDDMEFEPPYSNKINRNQIAAITRIIKPHYKEFKQINIGNKTFPTRNLSEVMVYLNNINESKGKGPHNKVKKGSQKRYKHPMGTDSPDKYIGKWEAYDEPQGINSPAGQKMVHAESVKRITGYGNVGYVHENPSVNTVISLLDKNGYVAGIADVSSLFVWSGSVETLRLEHLDVVKNMGILPGKMVAFVVSDRNPRVMFSTTSMRHRDRDLTKQILAGNQHYQRVFGKYPIDDSEMDLGMIKDYAWKKRYGETPKAMESYDNEEVLPDVKTYSPEEIARHHGVPLKQILSQVNMGSEVEFEHTGNRKLSMEIALDHLLELPDYYTRLEKMEEGNTMGPEFSRGLTNSSSGLGASPPETDFDPNDLPNALRTKNKMPGSKSPGKQVSKMVNKSIKNKVRKPNSPVTEGILNELFGGGNKLTYEWHSSGMAQIEVSEDVSIVVGFQSSDMFIPGPSGTNVGFATESSEGIHMGFERENLGVDSKTLIALFNTIIEIVQDWVKNNNPDRLYFVAVEPMKNIYPKLIDKFVPLNDWKVSKGPINIMGHTLDVYKVERKDTIEEAEHLPTQTKFNADYEVMDGEKLIGKATVTNGVIEDLQINQDKSDESFKGHALSVTLGTIIRDADLQGANLAMQIVDIEDQDMKRYLERFGFRHVGEGIFKRTAGSITPTSVIEKKHKR